MNVVKTKNMPEWVRAFQRMLYRAAKGKGSRRFGILYDKVCRWEVLAEAWKRVSQKGGSGGVDGQSIEQIEKEYGVERFLKEIQRELKEERYEAAAIRRVYIPKGDGGQRPLGIPTIKDRVIQMAVKLIIEPLFEADFLEVSYGFRPKRSAQEAVQEVHRTINRRKWVVDIDLRSYFDTIPHDRLMERVRQRVSDPKVLHLIRCWLKAGIMEAGVVQSVLSGTPQGGVLSPLLSNIYLHELDQRLSQGNGKLIRYADDLVILCWSRKEAERVLQKVHTALKEMGLELNEDKTRICHVEEGFDFLGFTFREGYSQRWKRNVSVKYPRYKSMQAIGRRIKDTIKSFPLGRPVGEVISKVNVMVRGWANYFRIGHSYAAALHLTERVCEQLRIYCRRRHQRKDMRGHQRWPNAFFYQQGLRYVPHLL